MVTGSDILAGMQGTVYENIGTEGSAKRIKEVQYWKKCTGCNYHTKDLGYVTVGPAMSPRTAIEFSEFQANKHTTPLTQYGKYIVGKVAGQKYDLTNPAVKFQAIIELGGINEFPLEQMIEYNWHRYPVMVQVRPELANIVEISCQHGCVNRKFIQTVNGLSIGYQSHCSVMHKDIIQSESIGRQFKEAMITNSQSATLDTETLTKIAIAIGMAMKNIPADSLQVAGKPLV